MVYVMTESLINPIVGGPDYQDFNEKERKIPERGYEIQWVLSERVRTKTG